VDLFYSYLSMNAHDRPVAEVDLDTMQRQTSERYMPAKYVDGNRMYASFTHLVGYSSNYYTYTLDKVIAQDFYSRFNSAQPLDGPMTMEYRKKVIDPGASKPAAQLVKDFLGRPQNMDALKAWLGQEVKN
jgi:thimet oligopeptidase